MNRKCIGFLLSLDAAVVLPAFGDYLQYQAKLTNPTTGTPLSGTHTITFRIYDSAAGSILYWQEEKTVNVTGGLANVLLGDVNPLPKEIFKNHNLWLGVTIGSDAEAVPRQCITSAAYAIHADSATNVIGVVPETGIAPEIARVNNVFNIVLANDGTGSGLNADLFDGLDSVSYFKAGGNAYPSWAYLGTTTSFPLTLIVNGIDAVTIDPVEDAMEAPNIICGHADWYPDVVGAVISGGGSTIGKNMVTDGYGVVGGGAKNRAGNSTGTVSDAMYATVGGGINNQANANFTTVAGGNGNKANTDSATAAGGKTNTATGNYATVSGGFTNTTNGQSTTIGGGEYNQAQANYATVGGGSLNIAASVKSTISGGSENNATGLAAAIGGGQSNETTADLATISGGAYNVASNVKATIGGGETNSVSGDWGTVGGGRSNLVQNNYATIAGGWENVASGANASVGGGLGNTSSGTHATVPGGTANLASGFCSFAAGNRAKATYSNSFVWGGILNTDTTSDRDRQVKFGADGGMRIIAKANKANPAALQVESTTSNGIALFATQTSDDTSVLIQNMGSGKLISAWSGAGAANHAFYVNNNGATYGQSWNNTCDRNAKEQFAPVDSSEVLKKLASLPITTWKYKSDEDAIRHIGPVAQDFFETFGVGPSDTSISTVDADGVALAAAQGLYAHSQEQATRIAHLEKENTLLKKQLDTLEARMATLEKALR